jgi:hypothetical protein
MATQEQRRIMQAVHEGLDLAVIEEAIIDQAPVEEDEKAALWLYAQLMRERTTQTRESTLVGS